MTSLQDWWRGLVQAFSLSLLLRDTGRLPHGSAAATGQGAERSLLHALSLSTRR